MCQHYAWAKLQYFWIMGGMFLIDGGLCLNKIFILLIVAAAGYQLLVGFIAAECAAGFYRFKQNRVP